MLRSIFASSFIVLCGVASVNAQAMHAITFCDTSDDRIGTAVLKDHDNMVRELGDYACFIDYDFLLYDYSGQDCNKSNLMALLSDIEIQPNDIIVFYYDGHGARAMNDESDPFPQMCLGSSFEKDFVPLKYAVDKLTKYKPALLVAMTNCCNKEDENVTVKTLLSQASGATSLSDINKEAFRKLFAESKGQAVITSSQAGEYSWCNSSEGGMFICDLLDVFYLVGQGKVEPNWESVFSNAKMKTSTRIINTNIPPYTATQTPYYTVNIKNGSPTRDIPDEKPKDVVKDVVKENDALAASLDELIDSSYSQDERLGMIPIIAKNYFSADAKVKTVGRNGMVVDYESVKDFLRRVALSRRIAKITIVNRDDKERHSSISIHEIHK